MITISANKPNPKKAGDVAIDCCVHEKRKKIDAESERKMFQLQILHSKRDFGDYGDGEIIHLADEWKIWSVENKEVTMMEQRRDGEFCN